MKQIFGNSNASPLVDSSSVSAWCLHYVFWFGFYHSITFSTLFAVLIKRFREIYLWVRRMSWRELRACVHWCLHPEAVSKGVYSFQGCLQPQSGLLSKVPTWLPGTRCSYDPASHSVQILLVSSWEELSLPDSCPFLFSWQVHLFFYSSSPKLFLTWIEDI